MNAGRIPRLRAPALTISILFAAVALSLALLGSLALADDSTTLPPQVTAEEFEATQPVSPSATASTSLRAHQPDDAVDGSKATHWAAISRNYPQWLVVDLGAPQRVVKSSIAWLRLEKSRKYFYRLEGSLDGESWQLLADRTKKSAYNLTNDSLDVEVQYLRVTVLDANRGRAGIKEIKVKKDATESDEWVVVTPTPEPSEEPTGAPDPEPSIEPTVTPTVSPTPTPTAPATSTPAITGLSQSSAKVGASLKITGTGFGTSQGDSKVTFGERVNELGFAPCAKTASVASWSDTSVTVTVPGMSPSSHPVYVTVGGKMSNSYAFSIDPVTVYTGRTFSTDSPYGNSLPAQHDVLYENCTFTATNRYIEGNQYGVLCIGRNPIYNVTFKNCVITSNTGPGSGGDYGVNGIKVIEGWGSYARDITFDGCTVGAMSRMGFECISDDVAENYGIALLDCIFEPDGAECISWGTPGKLYSLMDGCTLKGYGNLLNPQWGAGWEANQATHLETRNTEIWAGKGAAINVNGEKGVPCYLLFDNVRVDFGHAYQSYSVNYGARVFGCHNMSYSRWKNCTFDMGDAGSHCYNAGYVATGSYWAVNTYNDFSGSSITGYCGSISGVPSSAVGYWDPGANPTNTWPTKM